MPSGQGINHEWQKLFPPDYFTVLFLSLPIEQPSFRPPPLPRFSYNQKRELRHTLSFLILSLFKIFTSSNLFQSPFFKKLRYNCLTFYQFHYSIIVSVDSVCFLILQILMVRNEHFWLFNVFIIIIYENIFSKNSFYYFPSLNDKPSPKPTVKEVLLFFF